MEAAAGLIGHDRWSCPARLSQALLGAVRLQLRYVVVLPLMSDRLLWCSILWTQCACCSIETSMHD